MRRLLVLGLLAALAPVPAAHATRLTVEPARVGVFTGAVDLAAGADGGMVLAAATRRGIVIRRSRDGRRFGPPQTIARAPSTVERVRATIGADGAVLVAWTVADGSIVIEEDRDYDECCTRLWAGGVTAGGRVLRPRRLTHRRRRSVGAVAVAIDGDRRYVATTRPTVTRFADVARVWHGTGRRWSGGRAFAGRRSPYELDFDRVGGRTQLIGADRRGTRRRVRAWPVARGAGRTLVDLGRRTLVAVELAGGRVNGLVNRFDREKGRRTLSAFSAAGGRLATTPYRRDLEIRASAGDGRGSVAVAGMRSQRSPVAIRVQRRSGRVGRWIRLGRIAPGAAPYAVTLRVTVAASGRVTAWVTARTKRDERIVRLERLPDGRVRRTVDDDRPIPDLLDAATTAGGRSVAVVRLRGRLGLVR